MNEDMVLGILAMMLRDGAPIVYTDHARLRMRQRQIGVLDVRTILTDPSYVYKESDSQFEGKFNYRIVGQNGTSVVISIYFPTHFILVTVID